MSVPLRIACLVQRYGVDIGGGSEELCRTVAERLARVHDVTVLTTCARDYVTWRNELPPGLETLNNVRVRRFPVDAPRDSSEFDRISQVLFAGQNSNRAEEERWMRAQGPYRSALLDFLKKNGDNFDVFLFFTYLYATTYYGLPLVAGKAALIPTAHDEPPIYLSIFDCLFRRPRLMLFLTPEERQFVLRRFCLPEECGSVVGAGFDLDAMAKPCGPLNVEFPPALAQRLSERPYLLYLGRIDEGKGCHVLIDWFRTYVAEHPESGLQLVLAGRQAMAVPNHPDIVATGYLSESQKHSCLDNALALVAPSPHESLCISALEGWMRRKPVLANGKCAVLAGQCQRSRGGLWYRNSYEFVECLHELAGNALLRQSLGESGHEYVRSSYGWNEVERAYLSVIKELAGSNTNDAGRAPTADA